MNAILLAPGEGSRVQSLTADPRTDPEIGVASTKVFLNQPHHRAQSVTGK